MKAAPKYIGSQRSLHHAAFTHGAPQFGPNVCPIWYVHYIKRIFFAFYVLNKMFSSTNALANLGDVFEYTPIHCADAPADDGSLPATVSFQKESWLENGAYPLARKATTPLSQHGQERFLRRISSSSSCNRLASRASVGARRRASPDYGDAKSLVQYEVCIFR